MSENSSPLLAVNDLAVIYPTRDGDVAAVQDLSFKLEAGEVLGIVGESGSGKSQSMLALMGLLQGNVQIAGQALFNGQSLLDLPLKQLNKLRGADMAMVFQDPMTCLNPYMTVAKQMTEVLRRHKKMSQREALKQSIRMLDSVHIPDAARRIKLYPHEFSGGMRQRVMIAMALLCQPKLLICDEPTTALDVTIQAQILELLAELREKTQAAIVLITHDLGVVAGSCDRVLVMYAGRVVEQATVQQLFERPQHPYSHGLINSLPRVDQETALQSIPGSPPHPLLRPEGCEFAPRCSLVHDACIERPELTDRGEQQRAACHLGELNL